MSIRNRHFDVVILGSSLAARSAAGMLAKEGKRVLSLQESPPDSSAWLLPSLHLDRLLELLDGASCRAPAAPLQILTDTVRLEFHGPRPFEEELQREFPSCHREIGSALRDLDELGRRLEETLARQDRLLLGGFGDRSRLAVACLRRGLSRSRLRVSAVSWLAKRFPQPAGDVFSALFSGLSLAPAARLSLGETALLWRGVARSSAVSPAALDALLAQRYRQFHGTVADLNDLQAIHSEGRRITGLTLRGCGRISCSHCLLGSDAALPFLPQQMREAMDTADPIRSFVTQHFAGPVSELLAGRFILGGKTVWRASFAQESGNRICRIEGPRSETGADEVREALRPFLPFAEYRLEPAEEGSLRPATTERRPRFPRPVNRLRQSANLLLCDGHQAWPFLGTTGDLLTAFAITGRLSEQRTGKR